MRSEKSRKPSLMAAALVTACAATAAMVLSVGGCNNSPTGPADTSEILLVYPKGGESFKIGDSLHVKWTEQGKGKTDVNAVDVLLSPDSGKSWIYLNQNSITPGDSRWENFAWLIPDSVNYVGVKTFGLANSKCRIKVDQYTQPDIIFEISKDFTITH